MELKYLYGTAWKEELTAECTFNALKIGYRAIDTANQRKHYHEAGVGEGLERAYQELSLKRSDLFLQTKFTYSFAQDERLPYDPSSSLSVQVEDSFKSSLEHLRTDYLDSYLLHGLSTQTDKISEDDKETWRAIEKLFKEGKTLNIGVSNLNVDQLRDLYSFAEVKPHFVQIRTFAENYWEKEMRLFCAKNKIKFQAFNLLIANRDYLGTSVHRPTDRTVPQLKFDDALADRSPLKTIVEKTKKTPAQIIYKFCHQMGLITLTGTRDIEHMRQNLDIDDFELSPSELLAIENIAKK